MSPAFRERAFTFGQDVDLVGISCEPRREQRDDLGVVFLNSGLLHRVGAARLHVQLARALAAQGIASLRFDFSGIGDSSVRSDGLAFEQSCIVETQAAMDWLGRRAKLDRFVLIGLCSGADAGFWTAQADPRVVGLIQLDAFAYRTPSYYLHHYLPKVLDRKRLSGFISRQVAQPRKLISRLLGGAVDEQAANDNLVVPPYERTFPPKQEVAAGLNTLVERGVQLYNIFSGGLEEHINHQEQYARAFAGIDFQGRLRVDYLAEADHVFTRLPQRAYILREIESWILDHWPVSLRKAT